MDSLSFLRLLFVTHAAAGLQLSDHLVVFASPGESVTLPCEIPSIDSCSSIKWSITGAVKSDPEVVKAGRVTAPNTPRLRLLKDCSLEINHLVLNDARRYFCDNGALNSSVSLQILQVTEKQTSEIELQCFPSTYIGLGYCNINGIHIKWTTDDNTPLNGERFKTDNPSKCPNKLSITKKLTDHRRKWKCQLFRNDTVQAVISYTTKVKDGIEEVFAAEGESVSLSCSNTSCMGTSGGVGWAVSGGLLADDISLHEGQCHVNKDSSLVISKVRAVHAGNYWCSDSTNQQVLNNISLHTLDVTSEHGPGEDNLTLTCVLTCSKECAKDFNLTWSGYGQNGCQSGLMKENNTLIKRIFLPVLSTTDDLTCRVHRESAVVASKKWHTINSLQTPAWLALPFGLLICITAGGLYAYMKRGHNKDAGNGQSSTEMTHVYEDIQEEKHEEANPQRRLKREAAAATTDSFYDLLQAVS